MTNWLRREQWQRNFIVFFKHLLQFGYISDRIVVGDLLDYADQDLFRKVCHSHHSLNHCYHRNVFLLIYEHALVILSSYPSTLHCCIKNHLLWESYACFTFWPLTYWILCVIVISFIKVAFVCAFVTWIKDYLLTYLLTYSLQPTTTAAQSVWWHHTSRHDRLLLVSCGHAFKLLRELRQNSGGCGSGLSCLPGRHYHGLESALVAGLSAINV